MKIALVIERMDTRRGGRETSTAQIAQSLAKLGHAVTVLCQDGQPVEGITVTPLGRSGFSRAARLKNFVEAVRRQIDGRQFDIVHTMLPVPGADVYQLRSGTVGAQQQASMRRRNPLERAAVKTFGALNLHRRRMEQIERQVMADHKTAILAVSKMVAGEVGEFYGRTENVHVVYNAVELPVVDEEQRSHWRQQYRYRLGMTAKDTLFFVAAKNFRLKGVAETIEAFTDFLSRHVHGPRLVIAGQDPAAVEGYLRHASLRGVGGAVTFVGELSDLSPWYSAADVCVLLSWYDPCSRVVLEATRWGIPSITTKYNGAGEILADGAGLVVDSPSDRAGIVAAMEMMMDSTGRQAMAARCLEVGPSLSMDRHVRELLGIYSRR